MVVVVFNNIQFEFSSSDTWNVCLHLPCLFLFIEIIINAEKFESSE